MIIKCAALIIGLCALLLQHGGVHGAPGDEIWDYIEVRPGANMFFWLMYSRAAGPPESRPFVIWLTGGPGPGATAWGNYDEVGPYDPNLNIRNITWIDHAHVLFVDSPVGSGYSYVDSSDLFCHYVSDISRDLITMLKVLLTDYAPELKTAPLYILGESFGGVMGPDFAWELHLAIQNGEVSANLKGLIIRDGATSMDDNVAAYPEYMFNTGMVDEDGLKIVQYWVDQYMAEQEAQNYRNGSDLYGLLINEMIRVSKGGNIYYILDDIPAPYFPLKKGEPINHYERRSSGRHEVHEPSQGELIALMNGPVREILLPRLSFLSQWALQQRNVTLSMDHGVKHESVATVEKILNQTDIKVAVISGQLDLVCCNPGTERWVQRLAWPGADSWKQNPRDSVMINDLMEGYVKQTEKFSFWWINRAGHATFFFNPQFGKHFLANFTEIPWL